ncbi:MAG: DUF6438 domain-containing protein [Acidobacteriota bacterium]|nr:DUF6438 domain-containing protein [Acidobacteriota bacterium]
MPDVMLPTENMKGGSLLGKLALLLLLPNLWGCADNRSAQNRPAAQPSPAAQTTPPEPVIVFQQNGESFNHTPSYILSIYADGTVVFEGTENVNNKGRFTGEVDRGELRRLISEFERIGFFSLADNYDGKGACPTLWSDSPYVFITLNLDGRSKKVGRNAGCEGTNTQKELAALEDMVLRTTKVNRWLK